MKVAARAQRQVQESAFACRLSGQPLRLRCNHAAGCERGGLLVVTREDGDLPATLRQLEGAAQA